MAAITPRTTTNHTCDGAAAISRPTPRAVDPISRAMLWTVFFAAEVVCVDLDVNGAGNYQRAPPGPVTQEASHSSAHDSFDLGPLY